MSKICGAFDALRMLHENRQQGKHRGHQRRFAIGLFAMLAFLCVSLAMVTALADGNYLQVAVNFACDDAYQQIVSSMTSGDSLYVTIYQNGKWYKGKSIYAADGWKADWTDCPLLDAEGNPYEYTFSISNYKSPAFVKASSYENGLLTITETFRPTIDVTANFTFRDDDDDYYGRRPDPEKLPADSFILYYNSMPEVKSTSFTVDENGSYTALFENVPTYYYEKKWKKYTAASTLFLKSSAIPETNYKSGSSSFNTEKKQLTTSFNFVSQTVTYTHDIGVRNGSSFLKRVSSFSNAKKKGVVVPLTLTATLMENGEPSSRTDAVYTATAEGDDMPAINKTWHIPLYNEDGTEAETTEFSVKTEPSLEDGSLDKRFTQKTDTSISSNRRTIRVTSEIPVTYRSTISVTWDDNNNQMGLREAFPLNLCENGVVSSENSSKSMPLKDSSISYNQYPWGDLPVRDEEGKEVTFSIEPEMEKAYYVCDVQNQISYYYSSPEIKTMIGMKLRTQKVTADVEWKTDGSKIESDLRPNNVLLTLYTSADDGKTWQEFFGTPTYAVTQGENWHIEWNAPYCDAEGKPLKYKVEQNNLSLYKTTYEAQYPDAITEGCETKLKVTNDYVINWDYDVRLTWDTADLAKKIHNEDVTYSNSEISQKAALSISANQDYAAGQLSVRMPYQLFAYRDHKAVPKPKNGPKVECSLPMAPEVSSAYAFNYTIDKHDSDDPADWELVFTNWKDIASGYNMTATLRYTIDPYYTIDCTKGELQAVGTGQSKTQNEPTTHKTDTISYRLDTGINISSISKRADKLIYSGADYDFKNYNYVQYYIRSDYVYYNQPFRILIDEQPGDNGEVVSITPLYSDSTVTYNPESGLWETVVLGTSKKQGGYFYYLGWYVVVRYPRSEGEDPEHEGQMRKDLEYHNRVNIRYVAADEHEGDKGSNDKLDVYDRTAQAEIDWVDYEFNYTGAIYAGDKSMGSFNGKQYGITTLQYGQDVTGASVDFMMTVNGYNLKDGYRLDFYDDAFFARVKNSDGTWTDYVRLTSDDYEIMPVNYAEPKYVVHIQLSDIDRTNGETIDGQIPTEPFILWGRKDDAPWEKAAEITVDKPNTTVYIDKELLAGKGYTGLRLTSPDGMTGKTYAQVRCYVKLKGTSETIQKLIAENPEDMEIVNISSHEMYVPNEQGEYKWFNPLAVSSNDDARNTGLDERDKEERGAYISHRSARTTLRPATFSSAITKTVGEYVYDKANLKVEAPFTITAYETINTKTLPEDVYRNWSTDSGTFYDLLPLGYRYEEAKGVTVKEAGQGGRSALLESCTIVSNDYQGSGRQLLCFKVKSNRPSGENWNNFGTYDGGYLTGFTISFTASATNDDISIFGNGINVATYQRGDQKPIAGGYADDGHGRFDQKVFPTDDDGKYILNNVNGNSDPEAKNTLFAQCPVSPAPLPTIQTGIRKSVRAHSSSFVQDDISGLNEIYTYKVLVETSNDGYTSDIIIYDVLEMANNNSGWKGEFVSVDCSTAQLRGIDAKVYYSSDALNYSDKDDLSLIKTDGSINETHWKLLTDDVPGKDVKALAVDMRYLKTGDPLVLDTQSMVYFEVTMKAPDQLQPVQYAYNQPAYFCKYQGKGSSTPYADLTVGNVTSVNLRDLQDIEFRKVYLDLEGNKKPLGGARFSLFQCTNTDPNHQHNSYPSSSQSCWGKAIASMNSLANGSVYFRDLDSGVYAVYETGRPTGFKYTSAYWVFEVDAQKGTVTDPIPYIPYGTPVPMEKIDDYWTVTNERETRNFDITKDWTDNDDRFNLRPKELTFDLYRNGVLCDTKTVSVRRENDRWEYTWIFKNVIVYDEYGQPYTYEIREHISDEYTEEKNGVYTTNSGGTSTIHVYMYNKQLGILDVKKVLEGSDAATAFGFTVTLKKEDGTPFVPVDSAGKPTTEIVAHRFTTDAQTYTRETLTPDAQGEIHISVHPGETLRLLRLPYGTKWTVKEDENGYTTVSNPNPASGTINQESISTATFTNTAKPVDVTLGVHKNVVGSSEGTPFEFRITAKTDNAPMPAEATVTINGAGNKNFAPITFTNVGTYVYEVAEVVGNAGGYQYDDSTYTVTVVVTDQDGQLTAAKTVKKGDAEVQALTFTNTYTAKGSLSLTATKTVNGEAPRDDQTFDFELKNGADTPVVSQTKKNAGGNVTFDRIDYTLADAGKTYTYTVKETTASGNGMTVDATIYTVTVTIEDNHDGTLSVMPTYSNGVNETTAMVFRNTYEAAGSLTLTAGKQVNGNTPTDTQVFDFELASGADTPAVHQTKQNAGGNVSFDRIDYNLADAGKTYTYTVKETTASGNGMTVDTTIYTVTVAITDNGDGTLAVVPTYSNGTGETTAMVFHNTYEASGNLTLTAYKTVNGNTPTDTQVFDFELASGADTPSMQQTKQNAGGTIVFDPLYYTLADAGKTYTYTVKETSTDGNGFTTDKTAYTVHVLVEDNRDGTLKLTVTADDGQNAVTRLSFDNTYEANGKLSLKALKTVNGKEPAEDQRYTFELASGADTPVLNQIKENELGLVTFDDIAYTLADAGKTYQYTVRETTQDSGGLTVDKTVYTVTATVADNGNGTLTVTPVYRNGAETVQELAFDNKLAGSIVLSKKVEGEATDEEFTFSFTFTDGSGTQLTEKFAYTGSRTGEVGSGDTLKLKDGESVVFDSVPVGTICTVTEESRARYTTTVNAASTSSIRFSVTSESMPIAFVNTLVTTKFTVTKEWQGGDGGAITLTLYANGQKLDPQPAYTRDGDTYTYTGLPKYDSQGQTIVYSAKERYMDGYMTIYKNVSPYESESDFIYNGGTIINRAVTEIAVRKVWTGMDENEERPEITLTLYCNGQQINKKPKLDKNGWYHFYNLPLRESPYYVVETPVDGYATSYENGGSYADVTDRVYDGGTITNHKLPKTMDSQPLALYGFLLVVALAGVVFCWKKRQQD